MELEHSHELSTFLNLGAMIFLSVQTKAELPISISTTLSKSRAILLLSPGKGAALERTLLASGEGPTVAVAVAARSTARSEIAARAAEAAERRAAAAAAAGPAEETATDALPGAGEEEVGGEPGAADERETSGTTSPAAAAGTVAANPSEGTSQSAGAPAAVAAAADDDDAAAASPAAASTVWPCRRRRGSPSLFLAQRQSTGGLRCRGVGVGEGGRDTFRRHALSMAFASGLRTQRLRMGRTSNSRTAAGVARGHPESQGVHGRVAGGVSCMEFDSVGWQLAVAGENVTVYDFDRYLPEVREWVRPGVFLQVGQEAAAAAPGS